LFLTDFLRILREKAYINAVMKEIPSHTAIPGEDSQEESGGDVLAMAAGMMREAVRVMWNAARHDDSLLRLCLMRGAGFSLAEMAERCGCTKQAVHKRLKRLARRNPKVADYIRTGNPLDLYMETVDAEKN